MALNIKDESVHENVRHMTSLTGETQAEAVARAVQERLARLRASSRADRLQEIGSRAAAAMRPEFAHADHGEFLYDDMGLPR